MTTQVYPDPDDPNRPLYRTETIDLDDIDLDLDDLEKEVNTLARRLENTIAGTVRAQIEQKVIAADEYVDIEIAVAPSAAANHAIIRNVLDHQMTILLTDLYG